MVYCSALYKFFLSGFLLSYPKLFVSLLSYSRKEVSGWSYHLENGKKIQKMCGLSIMQWVFVKAGRGEGNKKYSFCILFVFQSPSQFILQNLIEITKCEINGLLVLVPICSMKRGAQDWGSFLTARIYWFERAFISLKEDWVSPEPRSRPDLSNKFYGEVFLIWGSGEFSCQYVWWISNSIFFLNLEEQTMMLQVIQRHVRFW